VFQARPVQQRKGHTVLSSQSGGFFFVFGFFFFFLFCFVFFLPKLSLQKGTKPTDHGNSAPMQRGKCQALVDFGAWAGDKTPTKSNFPSFNRYQGDRILLQENSKGWENYALHALFP